MSEKSGLENKRVREYRFNSLSWVEVEALFWREKYFTIDKIAKKAKQGRGGEKSNEAISARFTSIYNKLFSEEELPKSRRKPEGDKFLEKYYYDILREEVPDEESLDDWGPKRIKLEEELKEKVEEVPAEKTEEVPAERVEEAPAEKTEEVSAEKKEGKPPEKVEETPAPLEKVEETPTEKTEETPVGKIEEAPAEKIEEAPAEKTEEVPAEKVEEAPQPPEKEEETPAEKTEEVPPEKVEETPLEKTEETPVEKIEEAPAERPSPTHSRPQPNIFGQMVVPPRDWQSTVRDLAHRIPIQLAAGILIILLCILSLYLLINRLKPTQVSTPFPTLAQTIPSTSLPVTSATISPTPTAIFKPPLENILFEDNFADFSKFGSNNEDDKWQILNDGDPVISGGKLTVSKPTWLKIGSPDWTNYRVDFTTDLPWSSSVIFKVGIRCKDLDNMILVAFHKASFIWRVQNKDNPFDVNGTYGGSSSLQPGLHPSLTAQNDEFTFVIENSDPTSFSYPGYSKGWVALYITPGVFIYDFKIVKLP